MDREELARRLMVTFLGELADHVRAMNRDLLALEATPPSPEAAALLQTLFRTAHSLKGAARSVNVGPIEAACHQLEEILGAARDGRVPLTPEHFQVLFAAADAIGDAARRLQAAGDLAVSPLAALLPRLQAAARAVREQRTAEPTPVPPPVHPAPSELDAPVHPAPAAPSPAPAAPSPARPRTRAASPGQTAVRVTATKLDALVARSSELVVSQQRLQLRGDELAAVRESVVQLVAGWRVAEPLLRRARDAGALPRRAAPVVAGTYDALRRVEQDLDRCATALTRDRRALGRVSALLDDSVRRVRMLPFAEACQGLDRAVRDLARAAGKEAEVVVRGGDVELDRGVLDALRDPLLHLVRNAVGHGIEAPAARRAAGKAARGRIVVAAALRGAQVEVTVEDDGRGVDLARVRAQARRRGLPEVRGDREAARLVFLPGFSTADAVTEVSGRGIGLDVVSEAVAALHGAVDVDTSLPTGTRFTVTVPLTLSTLRVLLVVAAGQTFAFVGATVRALRRVRPEDLRTVEGREVLAEGGALLPVASLAATLGLPGPRGASGVAPEGGRHPVVVVAAGDRQAAFVVGELVAEQEVLVKNLGARLVRLRHVAGATILPSGRVALILNSADLVASAQRRVVGPRFGGTPGGTLAETLAETPAAPRRRLLVADDSVTTRTLMKSILEGHGFDVTVAADGADAWQMLQDRGADLVVSDVEMPRMDGFALAAAIRGSTQFRDLPVVLVTALSSEQDRARGVAAGADAYLPKSAFDQEDLLEAIARLL